MAGYCPKPGVFKAKEAEPEATLEIFGDYLETMDRVFRLSRRINPATGQRIEFDDQEKKDMLLIEGGDDMVDLFKHVGKVTDTDTYTQSVEKITTALRKRGNRTAAVFRLFNKHPQGNQSFDVWYKGVYKASKLIDWTEYNAEKAAVDALIMQTSSVKLQQRAIQENPNYEELVNLGISQEQAKKKSTALSDGEGETVSRLRQDLEKLKGQFKDKKSKNQKKCDKCMLSKCKGGSQCFALKKKCLKCQETGHFAASKLCPQAKEVKKSRRIEEAEDSGSESAVSSRILVAGKENVVQRMNGQHNTIFTSLGIKGVSTDNFVQSIKVATDTGVQKTILCRSDWNLVKDQTKLVKTLTRFRPYGTDCHLPIRGKAKVQLRAEAGAIITTYVYVNDDGRETSLLGQGDAEKLGIVTLNLRGGSGEDVEQCYRVKQNKKSKLQTEQTTVHKKVDHDGGKAMVDLTEEFHDIFGGIGRYNGLPVKIQMKENVVPIVQPPRRIPLHYVEPLKQHLDELVEAGVVEGPLLEEEEGSWISNLVITDKKWDKDKDRMEGTRKQIRVTLDCRPLNKHVYQTHEPIPTPDELRHQLRGSNKFSTLDMTHSFHQFELEEGAKKLFTFRTPMGLYRYRRLVMGNNPASSEAHRRIKTVVAGCEGVLQIKDDVLVHGLDEEHDKRLRVVLQRFREAELTFRFEKCLLGVPEVKWFGMVYSEHGMSADPDKVKLIKSWPAPRTVAEVKSFLQTVQFNSVYMAAEEGEMTYPELTAPLRELTKKKVRFTWSELHEKHFQLIKERLCDDRVMVPYDPARKTRLYTDGGPMGAQATVTQMYHHESAGVQWRPVAHTARAWTETEKRYSQIEKESNALYTGMVSNRSYLLGTEFEAVVDHKPLLPLYNNPKRPNQMRVDRHRMKLAAFDFHVLHEPGDKSPCDYGTRRGCPPVRTYDEKEKENLGVEDDTEIYVNRVVEDLIPAAVTRKMVQEATKRDNKLQMLIVDIQSGSCRKGLVRYTQVFDE